MLRKNIYKWHCTLSLIIAIPVFLWAVSGFMHPLMTNIKPAIASAFISHKPIDSGKIKIGIGEILKQHDIKTYHRFRLVSIDTNWFYQIQTKPNFKPVYLSTVNGKRLVNGDEFYAQYLGGKFLSEEKVLIKKIEHVQSFNKEYKEINRLLPVYKIAYQRADGIRLYVETTSDRLAYAVDDRRAFFDNIFSTLHNWGWMDALGDFKYILMALALSITILTTIMGLYILCITKSVKKKDNPALKARGRHRAISTLAFVFTLMFAFSGAFHALDKVKKEKNNGLLLEQNIPSNKLSPDFKFLYTQIQAPVVNISSVKMGDRLYWQVFTPLSLIYINIQSNQMLEKGDERYAAYLAKQYSSLADSAIKEKKLITRFEGEYGFINKRLPVWKIAFNQNDNARYYIETSTGYLSTVVKDGDLWEGLSFAYLHKHHFMEWSGKIGRDISTMFWALVQIILIITGLTLWYQRVKK